MMFKSNLVGGIVGLVLVCAFLGFMATWVKAIPLVTIIVIVVAMMIYDFVKTMLALRRGGGQ